MTNTNIPTNINERELFMRSLTYTIDRNKYQKLEQFPLLYDSLKNLLIDFETSDSQLTSIVCLLDHFNESFFEFVDSIEANPINKS